MKKIINGKVYDTSTAKKVGEYWNGGGWRDFGHYEEKLFRKQTGEFFLHGEGGPTTKYAVSCGQSGWESGEKIIPLSYSAAKKWAEDYLDADEYEAIFGEIAEDESRVQLCISISSSVADAAKRIAAERGISFSALVEQALTEEIEKK